MNLSFMKYSAGVGLIVSVLVTGACSGPQATAVGKCFTEKANCPSGELSTASSQEQCRQAGGKSWLEPGGTCHSPP
jgi:hypothetical protein